MNDNVPSVKKTPNLCSQIDRFFDDNFNIELVNICTTDGFNIYSIAKDTLDAEEDKIAAVSSTLCSLSYSCAEQMINGCFQATIIETETGNILIVSLRYLSFSCSLAVATNAKMSLGEARFLVNRLAKSISEIV